MAANEGNQTKTRRRSARSATGETVHEFLTGGILSSDFFFKHILKLLTVALLLIFYMSTKYQCWTDRDTIKRLERQLEVVKTEHIRQRSIYMSRIRESSMAAIADSIRPGLSVQPQPPFVLHLDKDK